MSTSATPRLTYNATMAADQSRLDRCADLGDKRLEDYARFRRYYRGDHNSHLTDRIKSFLEVCGLRFRENFCEPVIDVVAERMSVIGFNHDDESVSDWCKEIWEGNRLDATQTTVHATTLIKGDAFVMLDWDEEEGYPRIVFNKPELIKCHYSPDEPDVIEWASKVWVTSYDPYGDTASAMIAIQRLNIYHEDRIERYWRTTGESANSNTWMVWEDGDIPWVSSDGTPLGIPVFHFRNRPLGDDYGFSELYNVVSEQDALNKLVIDLLMVADTQSWSQRWASGVSEKAAMGFKNQPGEVWWTEDKDGKFGQFDSSPPDGIIQSIENTINRMARRSRIPLHLLTGGDMPSGESLRAAEAGLVKKVEDRQVSFGNSWEDVLLASMKLSDARGVPLGFDIPTRLQVAWDDAQSRNELLELQAAEIKERLGVSKATLLIELGYDAEDEAAKKADEAQVAADAMEKMMTSGGGLPPGPDKPMPGNLPPSPGQSGQ